MVNFIFTLQGETAEARVFSYVDVYLALLIREDKLSMKEVEQALQEFIFNMNVPTRVGFQTPFGNVTLAGGIPEFMKDISTVVGEQLDANHYGDYEDEVRMLNEAFVKIMCDGDANGRPFAFPILTYSIGRGRLLQARNDRQAEVLPDIVVANEEAVKMGAAPFYTNSTQLPVDSNLDLFEALERQEPPSGALHLRNRFSHMAWREAAFMEIGRPHQENLSRVFACRTSR